MYFQTAEFPSHSKDPISGSTQKSFPKPSVSATNGHLSPEVTDSTRIKVGDSVEVKESPREGRKVLPAIPDQDTEAEMTASLTNKPIIPGGSGNGQIYLEYNLMNE